MTRITGDEPSHWHDETGRHRMPDHRKTPGWKRSYGSADEKAYWDHLEAHDDAPLHRMDDDPAVVVALFDHIEAMQRTIAKSRELITAYRQQKETDSGD
jgi:hypothetical protein